MDKQELITLFSWKIRDILTKADLDFEELREIRLRAEKPMLVWYRDAEFFVTEQGELSQREQDGYVVEKKELMETMEYLSNYSMYAYEEELKQGYLTVKGGHRIGVA